MLFLLNAEYVSVTQYVVSLTQNVVSVTQNVDSDLQFWSRTQPRIRILGPPVTNLVSQHRKRFWVELPGWRNNKCVDRRREKGGKKGGEGREGG